MSKRYEVEHVEKKPRGWHVRSRREGKHVIRMAFPPGPRKRGTGEVVEILHPKSNPFCVKHACSISRKAKTNPAELLIFGNPAPRHSKIREGRERAERIRGARFSNPADVFRSHQIAIAKKTLKMPDQMVKVMGGMTKAQAREILKRFKNPLSEKDRAAISHGSKILETQGYDAFLRHIGQNLKRHQEKIDKRKMRSNSSETEQAVKLFEGFHGRDAEKIVEAQRSAAMRLDYAACGPLVAVGFDDNGYSEERLPKMWDKCPHVNFEGDKVVLASAPNGKQLYFIGGNQNLDSQLSDFKEEGVDIEKDLIDLGAVYFVVYEARKAHDNFEPADYCHRFGKGDQSLPRLAYDKVKKEMLLIGGEYFISIEAGLSPGIEG